MDASTPALAEYILPQTSWKSSSNLKRLNKQAHHTSTWLFLDYYCVKVIFWTSPVSCLYNIVNKQKWWSGENYFEHNLPVSGKKTKKPYLKNKNQ